MPSAGASVGTRLRRRVTRLPIGASVAARMVLGLTVMVGIGTAVLSLPSMTTEPLTFMDTLFTAASAVTVTGLTVVTTSTAFTPLGQFVVLALIQFGGLGYVVLVVAALRLVGRRVPLTERLALANELGVGKTRLFCPFARSRVHALDEAAGARPLYWGAIGMAPRRTLFYAVFTRCRLL
jgi:Trk-type K+ transport system membrane component